MSIPGSRHQISFGPKFTQLQLNVYLVKTIPVVDPKGGTEYFSHWDLSFHERTAEVTFDLSLTEWVSTEQINFLFAWMRTVRQKGKRLKIILPVRRALITVYSPEYLSHLSGTYAGPDGEPYLDDPKRTARRQRSSDYLMSVYGLFASLEYQDSLFTNLADTREFNRKVDELRLQEHQVIPFTIFDISYRGQHIKFDTQFQDLIGEHLDTKGHTSKIFEIESRIALLLRKYSCYSPFESKIISNVITQELYINSLQHAYQRRNEPLAREAYLTVFLANRWKKASHQYFFARFEEEKYKATLAFYKDKKLIKSALDEELRRNRTINSGPGLISLSGYNKEYKNISYLEYSFTDFGDTIPETLRAEFIKNRKSLAGHYSLSPGFSNASESSQIIEYALLLDTSREPLDKTIDYYELVPRGLYFLVDMVRRYAGMMIIRSGDGMLICDFSDRLYLECSGQRQFVTLKPTISVNEAIVQLESEPPVFYPGTQFTIIIPEKAHLSAIKKNNTSVSPVRADLDILNDYAYGLASSPGEWLEHRAPDFTDSTFQYISILFIYNEIIEQCKITEISQEIHVKEIYNLLLARINHELDRYSGKSKVLFFDFAGLKGGNASWIKVLYYLIITPKINELTKGIIFNLPDDEDKVIRDLIENYIYTDIKGLREKLKIPEPYLYKPIPCLHYVSGDEPVHAVEWIGLKHRDDKELLTNLLLGKKRSYKIDLFRSPENTEGTVFFRQADRLLSSYSGLEDIRGHFYAERKKEITAFLKRQIKQGLVEGEEREVFLTSGGGYQFEYLSLYDVLHDKYVARYFAKCLLDDYYRNANDILREELKDGGTMVDYSPFCFTKIIAVTISSQLIATAMYNLLLEEEAFRVLLRKDGDKIIPPTLIMLSSYYSFDIEKPFEKIEDGDVVMIVNDVISTGKLVRRMLDIIEKRKKAVVNAVFSIADTRIPESARLDMDGRREITCESISDIDPQISFTLADFASGLVIRKYYGPYKGTGALKRINPLLNAVVGFREVHTESHKLLFENVSGIIADEKIDAGYFKVGHFIQNLNCCGYMTELRPLFSKPEGHYLTEKLYRKLNSRYKELRRENLREQLQAGALRLAGILEGMPRYEPVARELREHLATILAASEAPLAGGVSPDYKPDFIFYPVFSGVEKLGHLAISRIFGTHEDNVVGLQRFETPKGWRFPVPAKRLNHLTYQKKALLIDTGSMSGDSLIQMIDTVCVLEVREIIVLSIISRTEDFSREMFSRIKSLKVKRLQTAHAHQLTEHDIQVPADIIFGINLQIPVYHTGATCPICAELRQLDNLDETHVVPLTDEVKEYVTMRKSQLALLNPAKEDCYNAPYLPLIKNTRDVDTRNLFRMRHQFGRIDTYRFYPDYFEPFNELQTHIIQENEGNKDLVFRNPDTNRELELMLICLLHEPGLVELLNNFLTDLVLFLIIYLKQRLLSSDSIAREDLFYDWEPCPLLQVAFTLFKEEFFVMDNFKKVLAWNDANSKLLMHFQLWDTLYRKEGQDRNRETAELLLRQFLQDYNVSDASPDIYDTPNREYYRILTRNYQLRDPANYGKLDLPFYNLSKFLFQGQGQERHFFLKDKINEVIDAILEYPVTMNKFVRKFHEVVAIIEDELLPNLDIILSDPGLRVYCRTIYAALAEEHHGIVYYFRELLKIYKKIVSIPQAEVDAIADDISQVKELLKVLMQKKLDFSVPDGFYDIFSAYPTDLSEELAALTKKTDAGTGLQISVVVPDGKPCPIRFHRLIFETVLHEVIKNAKTAHTRSSQPKPLKISFECKPIITDPDSVMLAITQSLGFIAPAQPQNKGGLVHIVGHYLKAFGGFMTDNRAACLAATDTHFVINLILKMHRYE